LRSIFCTNCHSTIKLSPQHYSGLTSPSFDGAPGSTLGGAGTSISAYLPYASTVPSGTCTSLCHGVRNWIN
jgi:hypothetical protein